MCPGELEPPHAKAKGSECRNERKPGRQALAAGREQVCRRVRRPAGRSRGRATPATRTALADAPFPTEPDLPVCERHDPTGEPGALNRHAGFGERGAETWQCERMRHPHDAKAAGKRLLPHAKAGASLPDSTATATLRQRSSGVAGGATGRRRWSGWMASGRARWASRRSAEHLTLTWPRQPCHRRIGRSARSLWAGRSAARKDSQSGGGPRALTASNSNANSTLHSPTCRLRRNGRPSCKPSWRTCNASVQMARRRSAEPMLGVPEKAGI